MKARNLSVAATRWIKAGRPVRSDEEVAKLFEMCKACEHFKIKRKSKYGNCSLCGCRLNLGKGLNKLRWATEICPAYKWGDPAIIEEHKRRSDESLQYDQAKERAKMDEKTKQVLEEQEKRNRDERRKARKARQQRRKERLARKKRREEERAREEAQRTPEMNWVNPDRLEVYDRQKLPATLKDLWRNCAAFYVCGGPSLKTMDLSPLKERGIVSLGINNVAGYAPVRAMTFSDPPSKFHHGIFLDPALLKFVPIAKLKQKIRVKTPDGEFKDTVMRVSDCPNVFAYKRGTEMTVDNFLDDDQAHWGRNKKAFEKLGEPKMLFTFFLGLRLLHYFGVRRVYMIGVDFNMSNDVGKYGNYAFKEHRWNSSISGNNEHYRKAADFCQLLRPKFEEKGFHVYNCNPDSGLKVFDYVPYHEAVEDCRGHVPKGPFDLEGWYDKDGSKNKKAAEDKDASSEGAG